MTRAELIKNKEYLRSKAVASISGLAIGDSFGDASRKPENQLNYGITTDFNKGASWSTDDTEFALLTAKILIDCKGNLTSDEVVKGWLENVATQDEFHRGGNSEIEAAQNLRKGLRPPITGKFNSYHISDGAAMRISPIGIICAGDPEKAVKMAEIDASISHYQDGIWGAQAVAAAVAVAMTDASLDEILSAAVDYIPKDSWTYDSIKRAYEIVEKANYDFFDSWMVLHDELATTYRASVPEAVASAFGVIKLCGSEFKKGVIMAGNFSRDADTIGAIAGAVLGAKYGLDSIPERWVAKTRYPTGTCLHFTKGIDLIDIGEKLAALVI